MTYRRLLSRQFLFRHYWWIAALAVLTSLVVTLELRPREVVPIMGSVLATGLAFCYFMQQQRLAEIQLFKSLFTEFNARYNDMNSALASIAGSNRELAAAECDVIVDYFNLCAEEYLFYKEGFIHPDVWSSWCAGMLWYFQQEPFASEWARERTSDSYYGLTIERMREGASKT